MALISRTRSRRARGFTLIELLVVLAIVAVLAAIAYPSYVGHIARGKRADARATLLAAAQFMERYYSAQSQYLDAVLPKSLSTAPIGAKSAEVNYLIKLVATEAEFTITAQPVNADVCGNLVITQTGARTRTGAGLSDAACWK
ncbi:MAG TPA: type IV pilin protein [Ramlibacter sp.]|nr:type IV pilin protein [Ramlibacter sp.]